MKYDVGIIGSGPAGLSAAIYAKRANLSAVVIEKEYEGTGQIAESGQVDNYPGELTLQTPESFFKCFHINMKIHHEVISIHPDRKTVSVKNLENGEIFEENYDKLILSPGAKPTQPRLPGVGIDKLFTFRTVEDTFRIKEYLNKNHPKTAGVLLIKHWIIIRM
jgi:thioredoxin reductase